MPSAPHRSLRRRALGLVVALLCLVGSAVALPATHLAPGTANAAADTTQAYDRSLGAADCALLGRAYAGGLGCARAQCVPGAVAWRRTAGAEACALPGQRRGFGYAATVPVRDCLALHRRWIAAANYCASEPDRTAPLLRDAPQCTAPASVYVVLAEKPGRYDECLTESRVDALSQQAAAEGTTLAAEAARSQRVTQPTARGPLLVGDSISWRGSDELARLWPALAVDGEPGRRPTELAGRIAAFTERHGPPTAMVVELGTNPSRSFHRRDLAAALRVLPATTPVMLVLPRVEVDADPVVVSGWTQRFDRWMRSVAAGRPRTCLAGWPAYVDAHPGVLQDGIHPRHDAEDDWARWLVGQWARCR